MTKVTGMGLLAVVAAVAACDGGEEETICCERTGGALEVTSETDCTDTGGSVRDLDRCESADAGAEGGMSGGMCACGDPGAMLVPVSGCETWTDATMCSGWASAVLEQRMQEHTEPNIAVVTAERFANGTSFTGFGCTIRIECP